MEIAGPGPLGTQFRNAAPAPGPPDNRQLIQAAKAVNAAHALGEHEIAFSIDHTTHLPVFKIVDRTTKEVVDQVPPEYVLQLAANLGKKP